MTSEENVPDFDDGSHNGSESNDVGLHIADEDGSNYVTEMEPSEFSQIPSIVPSGSKPKRRKSDRSKWKVTVAKRQRRNERDKGYKIDCTHELANHWCKVRSLSNEELKDFHDAFWKCSSAMAERFFLMNNLEVSNPRRSLAVHKFKKKMSIRYFIKSSTGRVNVCRNAFLSVLSIGKKKAEFAAKQKLNGNVSLVETRGGRRIKASVEIEKRNIMEHLKSFQCLEKHYSSKNSPGRNYNLPEGLSIRKMWIEYCVKYGVCRYSHYYSIFTQNYKRSQGSTNTEACRLGQIIKHEDVDTIGEESIAPVKDFSAGSPPKTLKKRLAPGRIEVYIPQWDACNAMDSISGSQKASSTNQCVSSPLSSTHSNSDDNIDEGKDDLESTDGASDDQMNEDDTNISKSATGHSRKTLNEFSMFAQFIAEELKLIKNPVTISELKFKMHEMIYDAIDKEREK